jgi:hypothetical protein
MDDYPYATLGADGWFRCDGLHRPGFPTLLRDVLHRFSYTGFPTYHGRPYRQLGLGRCKVHVGIPAHPTDPTMTAWFTTARGDDLDDTRTRLQHAQDELVAAQSYVHHLETELHERDEQLEASQAQTADLQHQVEHLQELIPEEPEESEEDLEEIEGMSNVDDD